MSKIVNYIFIGILFLLLVVIRGMEDILFYDPFIIFFQQEFNKITPPDFNNLVLFLNHLFRYVLNTVISLVILFFLFKNWQIVKISTVLYAIVFCILISIYMYLINNQIENHFLMTFYIRRFLIQPLLVFILIPAYYYQKKNANKH